MTVLQPQRAATGRRRRRPAASLGTVVALEPARIERALLQRQRYRYVRPRVEREGSGWKIVSPNCSRSIDPSGGEIPIAWFEPQGEGRWTLHGCDRADNTWYRIATAITLDAALECVCTDALGRFWP